MAPGLTDFEIRVLDCLASGFGDQEPAFRKQVASATFIERQNTGSGFVTQVAVDRASTAPVTLHRKRGQFAVKDVEYGIGIILWDRDGDGYLHKIEGYTYKSDLPFDGVSLANIEFVEFEG